MFPGKVIRLLCKTRHACGCMRLLGPVGAKQGLEWTVHVDSMFGASFPDLTGNLPGHRNLASKSSTTHVLLQLHALST